MKSILYLILICFCLLSVPGVLSAEVLVAMDAMWAFWDRGELPGADWAEVAFDDVLWERGLGPLGYGDRGERTMVAYGPDPQDKFLATYFRHSFWVSEPSQWSSLLIELLCDDGAVVYINGEEVLRENMPAGDVDAGTVAAERGKRQLVTQELSPSQVLWVGRNTIAAEVHQWRPGSSDLFFQLSMSTEDVPEPSLSGMVEIDTVLPPAGRVTELDVVQVTFDRPVWGVDARDLLVNGIPAVDVQGKDAVYTFTMPELDEGPVMVTWQGDHAITSSEAPPVLFDSFADDATWFYELVDVLPPQVERCVPTAGATLSSLETVTIWFDEPVGGVDAEDLWAGGQPATDVEGSGAGPYQFKFNALPIGSVSLHWAANHGIHDFSEAAHVLQTNVWSYELADDVSYFRDVVIHEIMYHPASGDSDEEFIELVNLGTQSVNLTGWCFDRGVDFCFPEMSLAPGDFLIVAADVNVFRETYAVEANVVGPWQGRLSNSGETLELEDAQGQRVDSVAYADEGDWAQRQRGDWDRGHQGWMWYSAADGGGASLELCQPSITNDCGQNWASSLYTGGTPGQWNSVRVANSPPMILNVHHEPIVPRATDTVTIRATIEDDSLLNHAEVNLFYQEATTQEETESHTIRMLDDGWHDDGEEHDGIYAGQIPALPVGTVVSFYVVAEDETGLRRRWPAAVTGGADTNDLYADALYQVDHSVYTGSQPVFRLVMTERERYELEHINRASNAQMNATLITQLGGRMDVRYNVGVRIRGAGSRKRTPPNYRVNIPSDRRWNDVTALNLNTQYTYGQVLGSVLSLKSGLPAANAQAVQVRVNGENLAHEGSPQFGSYAWVEVINGEWAQNHYPEDDDGNTYACRRPNTGLNYLGNDPAKYLKAGYNKTSHASENDWSDLIQLIDTLSNAPDEHYVENVSQVAHVQEWMTYFAVLSLLTYGETALGTGVGDDYNLYRGVKDTRFLLLPHDFDTILGQGDGSTRPFDLDIYQMENLPVIHRLMQEPRFRTMYHAELQRLLATVFSEETFNSLLDRCLGEWIPMTIIEDIKQFASDRRAFVTSQLALLPPHVQATIQGEPASTTTENRAILSVGGDDIAYYRYRLNGGEYSSVRSVSQPIVLTDLPVGSHSVTVLGQDVNGNWQSETDPSYSQTWTVLPNTTTVVINEVLAKNVAAVSYYGRYVDLIELFNTSNQPVDLSGMSLSDNSDKPHKFVFAEGMALPAKSYLTLAATDAKGSPGLYTGFSLDRDGEAVYLFAANGNILDAVIFGAQLNDWSIGRGINGEWGLTSPSFGAMNQPVDTGRVTDIVINEWMALGNDNHEDDYIELYNNQSLPVNVGNLFLTNNPIGAPSLHAIQPLSFIPGFGFLTFYADSNTNKRADHLRFKLAAEQGMIALLRNESTWIDYIYYMAQRAGISEGREPDGTQTIQVLPELSPGQVNTNMP